MPESEVQEALPFRDREGRPIDLDTWRVLKGDLTYVRLAWNTVGNVIVSTVWEGVTNPHRVFQTMVFTGTTWPPAILDDFTRDYQTEVAARSGHAAVLAELQDTREVDTVATVEDLANELDKEPLVIFQEVADLQDAEFPKGCFAGDDPRGTALNDKTYTHAEVLPEVAERLRERLRSDTQ